MTPKGRFAKLSEYQKAILLALGPDYEKADDPENVKWTPQQKCRPKPMLRQILHESVQRLIQRGLVEKKPKERIAMLRLTEEGFAAVTWLRLQEQIRQLEEE